MRHHGPWRPPFRDFSCFRIALDLSSTSRRNGSNAREARASASNRSRHCGARRARIGSVFSHCSSVDSTGCGRSAGSMAAVLWHLSPSGTSTWTSASTGMAAASAPFGHVGGSSAWTSGGSSESGKCDRPTPSGRVALQRRWLRAWTRSLRSRSSGRRLRCGATTAEIPQSKHGGPRRRSSRQRRISGRSRDRSTSRPLLIAEHGSDRVPRVVAGASVAVRFVGPDRVQDRVPHGPSVDVAGDPPPFPPSWPPRSSGARRRPRSFPIEEDFGWEEPLVPPVQLGVLVDGPFPERRAELRRPVQADRVEADRPEVASLVGFVVDHRGSRAGRPRPAMMSVSGWVSSTGAYFLRGAGVDPGHLRRSLGWSRSARRLGRSAPALVLRFRHGGSSLLSESLYVIGSCVSDPPHTVGGGGNPRSCSTCSTASRTILLVGIRVPRRPPSARRSRRATP